jgi:hypothetical protein
MPRYVEATLSTLREIIASFELPGAVVVEDKDTPKVTPLTTPKHRAMFTIHPTVIVEPQFLMRRPTDSCTGSTQSFTPDLAETV